MNPTETGVFDASPSALDTTLAANDCTRFFDTFAADARWLAFTTEEQMRVEAFLARWGIRPGDRVLEPGCGSGRLTALLAPRVGLRGSVVAFDSAPALIAHANARRLPPQVAFVNACATSIELAAETFDHVICFNVFPHLVPVSVVAARLATTLRAGGVFWIAHTCSRAFLNDIHKSGPSSIQDHVLPEPASLRSLLEDAGLVDVAITDAADHFLACGIRPGRSDAMSRLASHV